MPSARPCRRLALVISVRDPTLPAPTAKPSVSSKRCSANGPTSAPIARQPSAVWRCALISRTTTRSAVTLHSASNLQLADSVLSEQPLHQQQLASARHHLRGPL